ncbi:Protein ACTIVITY OF BC1 COMPLEX KINASE 7, chloroplastic [Trifolium repens]|nr:Protein ACTIVITY OF BC1 COMPLEX KINASE 7, chloroplastic [Trifolium repens]
MVTIYGTSGYKTSSDQKTKHGKDVRTNFMSIPYKVQIIEDFVKQVEARDMKLRVRVVESERAARKATVLQMATRAARKGTI